MCKLLEENRDSLTSLEFIHCKLPAALLTALCKSLHVKGFETNVIKNFSIKRSSFLDTSSFPLPLGLESLLSAARGLTSLTLCDNRIWWKTASMVLCTLLDTESNLEVLDLSENNIVGWLTHFKCGVLSGISSDQHIRKSLKRLRVLNLRGNNLRKDDADHLKYALVYMPNLQVLNLSDNPIQDEGSWSLIPYLCEKSEHGTPLAELYLENCELTCHGANQLLAFISSLTVPLKFLSLGHNHLGSKFGESLGRFLRTGIQSLDVKGIGLGSVGFSEAQKEIVEKLSLVRINLSKNSGGSAFATFFSKMISMAPALVSVNAANNWITTESLPIVCSCIKAGNGKLEHLDLRGNPLCNEPGIGSILAKHQINGKPNIILASPPTSDALYDHDP